MKWRDYQLKSTYNNYNNYNNNTRTEELNCNNCKTCNEEGLNNEQINATSESQKSPIDARVNMCQKVISMIQKQYVSGTFDFLRERNPKIYQGIVGAEKRANEISRLLDNTDSSVNIADFKTALNELYRLNISGIRLYKKHLQGDNAANRED